MKIALTLYQNYLRNVFFILLCFLFLFSLLFSFRELEDQLPRYSIKIDKKLLSTNYEQPSFDFDHGHGQNIPNDLVLKISNGEGKIYFQPVSDIGNNSISHNISVRNSEIKNIFLQSDSSLKLEKNGRILQSVQQLPPSFIHITKFLTYLFSCCRNLVILACITATFDLWMPLLMFIEAFICLGFWTHDPHQFTQIYSCIFQSKFDLFNLVRLSLTSDQQVSRNPYIGQYGFTDKFAINCAGEICGLIILMLAVLVLKFLVLFLKNEKLRSIDSNLRPICNGYLFWMSPKVLSLAGLALRQAQNNLTPIQILHLCIGGLLIAITLLFFILLVVQIRKINTKLEYIEESRNKIGLASRIDHQKDFQFDCLEYSMLYYPAMVCAKNIFSHLCIGFAPDFHYVQFGGVMAGQVFIMMIQISSSGYKLTRDRVLNPILDFMFGTFLLCLIGIGLVYRTGHLELTINLQKFGFSLIILITSVLLIQTLLDIVTHIKKRGEESAQWTNEHKKTQTKSEDGQKQVKSFRTNKKQQKQLISNDTIYEEQKKFREKNGQVNNKIKKIKNGKLI